MARRKSRMLTEVELEFMQAVWSADREVTTEQVLASLRQRGRDLADGSVRKVLSILVAKRYLTRRPEGRGFLYRAKVPKDRASRSMVVDLVRRVFAGSATGMVAALLDSQAVEGKDIETIKRLIEERERGEQR